MSHETDATKTVTIDVPEAADIQIASGDSHEDTGKPRITRVTFVGRVDSHMVGKTIDKIFTINEDESADRIELWLNSHGGDIDTGLGLYDVIKMSPIPVDTVAVGCAMSMAQVLLQAGQIRYATPNTTIMIHRSRGGAAGDPETVKATTDNFMKLSYRNKMLVGKRVGMTYKELMEFMGAAKYMMPTTAKKYNFIDAIKKTW